MIRYYLYYYVALHTVQYDDTGFKSQNYFLSSVMIQMYVRRTNARKKALLIYV
jgi:hypothetical protein